MTSVCCHVISLWVCPSVVMVAGALVELFCRANWTGPPLPPLQPITDKQWQQVCLEEMSIAGEVGVSGLPLAILLLFVNRRCIH